MNPEQPILWHQGLFLQPQHFQHLDCYHQSLLHPFQSYLQPYFWGVHSVEISEAALLNRVVEVTKAEIIFQDGTWVLLGKNGILPARSFADRETVFLEEGASFPFYVGLKRWDRFGVNVAAEGRSTVKGARYQSNADPVELADLYQNGPAANLFFMNYSLELFWKDEIKDKDDYSILPFGRLRMKGENIRAAADFIPPVFMVQGSPQLLRMLKQIREHVQSRCRVLETYKPAGNRPKDMESVNFNYLSALKSLNKYLALLHHVIETPKAHPWTMFAVLRQLIAELSTFSDRMNALGHLRDGTELLPAYNHLDLETCFGEAIKIAGELLESIVMGSENIITMIRRDDMFSCQIPPDILHQRGIYCLMIHADQGGSQIIDTVIRRAKAGHCGAMSTMIARALSGVPMEYHAVPPPGMARRADSWCFQLDIDHPRWHELATDGRFCLYWESAPKNTAIELVITRI